MSSLFFVFKKIVEFAIFPPGIIIIAFLIIAYLTRRTKLASIFSLFCAFCLYALSIKPVSNYLLKPLESAYNQPKTLKADCIVVLSAGSYNSKTLDADSLNRLVSGYILFRKTHLPIILSGGYATSTTATADIMKNLLIEFGVNPKDIMVDAKSNDTNQNALNTALICKEHNFNTIILITSAYHMKRAVFLFKKTKLTVIPYPTDYKENYNYNFYSYFPALSNLTESSEALREDLGYVYYKLRGQQLK
jgi:uncharacterized SAM-binding protein YcdF (DUF218 family)